MMRGFNDCNSLFSGNPEQSASDDCTTPAQMGDTLMIINIYEESSDPADAINNNNTQNVVKAEQ